MILFFFYPFVAAFAAAIPFDTVGGCLTRTPLEKGLMFGALLLYHNDPAQPVCNDHLNDVAF